MCLCDCLEASPSVMDHNILSAMFLPDNNGSHFRRCNSIVMSVVLSKSLYQTAGLAHVKGKLEFCDDIAAYFAESVRGVALGHKPLPPILRLCMMTGNLQEFLLLFFYWQKLTNLVVHLFLHLDCGHVSALEHLTPNNVIE